MSTATRQLKRYLNNIVDSYFNSSLSLSIQFRLNPDTMLFSTASVLLGAALSFTLPALAISNLKAIPLSADCSSYPAYNSSADTAGPWSVVADSTGYAPIDGLRVSIESFTNNGTDRYGFVRTPFSYIRSSN